MDDPLRPSDEIFKQIYEQGFTTWHALYQKAIPLSRQAPLLRLENEIPQHPKFPSYIEIGDDASRFLDSPIPRLSGAVRQSSFTPQAESQPWGSDEG
jgi:hypothetical protein